MSLNVFSPVTVIIIVDFRWLKNGIQSVDYFDLLYFNGKYIQFLLTTSREKYIE